MAGHAGRTELPHKPQHPRGEQRAFPRSSQEGVRGGSGGRWERIAYLFVSWNTLLRISAIAVSAGSFGKQSSFSSFPAARDLIRKCTILHSTLKWKTSSPGREAAGLTLQALFGGIYVSRSVGWLVPSPERISLSADPLSSRIQNPLWRRL